MLLSQRIAQDPGFLKEAKGSAPYAANPISTLRLQIAKSVKIIAGKETFVLRGNNALQQRNHVTNQILGFTEKTTDEQAIAKGQAKFALYAEYARLPFPSICIENDTGLIFLQTAKPIDGEATGCQHYVQAILVETNGVVSTSWHLFILDEDLNAGIHHRAYFMTNNARVDPAAWVNRGLESKEAVDEALRALHFQLRVMVLESLLFLNVTNARLAEYTPSKRENKSVPKPFLPFYSYYILDVFREKTVYASLEEVKQLFTRSEEDLVQRRAHMVRAHWKRKNGKLFRWMAFWRNARHAETLGVIEKDYRLNP